MSNNYIADLLDRYQRGECTPREKARVEQWFEAHRMAETHFDQMSADEQENWTSALFADIQQANQPKVKTIYRKLYPYTAAASVILLIGSGLLFLKSKPPQKQAGDVAPYTAKAILKTGHGKMVLLDSAAQGFIAQQGNITVSKTAEGQISYSSTNKEADMIYDTIQVPAGGRPYQVKLSDGSKFLLNAATSIRYPESFSASRRGMVELISGEIYAEVVHNAKAPLQIKAPGQLITDIGTEFNISAYPDEEDTRTTLVEGAVKVGTPSVDKLLKPGEQAILKGNNLTVNSANIEQATAWKNGYFRFSGDPIDVIMRQLARWYNIEVIYEGKKTNEVFYGKITRKKNISEVLKMLEKTQKIHFKIEGRRVTVWSKS